MKLSYLRVRNLRSVEEISISIEGYTSLIGPNNAGKSTLLRAVELLLNQESPAEDEWRKGHEDSPIVIEARFTDISDWERLKPGVAALVHDDAIHVRVSMVLDEAAGGKSRVSSTWEAYRCPETIEGFAEKFSTLSEEYKQYFTDDLKLKGTQFKTAAHQERLKALIRERHPERVTRGDPEWSSEGISIAAALQQALPRAELIPAVRDATEDSKPTSKTSFGLLLRRVLIPAIVECDEYKALTGQIEDLQKRLHGEGNEQLEVIRKIADEIRERLTSLISAQIRFSLEPPDAEKFIGSSTLVELDDGTRTRIALQGHGLQRALVFALIEVLATRAAIVASEGGGEAEVRSTVLLFEEPELFIHPHVMRRLKVALELIAARPEWQVIVTTHSPFLVDIGKSTTSLIIHQRVDAHTPPTVRQLEEDPFGGDDAGNRERELLRAVLNFHPTVCEAFFARRVVLVEGPSELAILANRPELASLAGVDDVTAREVSVVECAGKWTIVPIARVLRAFQIPVRVIHDRDAKGRSPEVLAQCAPIDPWRANARIAEIIDAANLYVVDDTLEHLLWPDGDGGTHQSDKPYRAWKRVGELCIGHENLDHAPGVRDLVRFAYEFE